ncbi:hypothetical protein GGI17_006000 [Coemansia sp. S146]|nr:hypothetical protein GGI17_006000 [Coemansia sp. S146]
MINNGPAYASFIVVIVVLVCLGTWVRRRRIQAAIMQRDQMELESRLNTSRSNAMWTGGTGPMQPAHAHLRQPHTYSADTKPDEYLPPYSQPMSSQPPPYASSMADSPTHLRAHT